MDAVEVALYISVVVAAITVVAAVYALWRWR
jgi:hypothetical protein